MAEADWTVFTDDLNIAALDRGVTTGIPRPNGGGSFVFGFNSLTTAPGAAGYFTNQNNFAPTPANKGGRITAAIQRGLSGGQEGFSPFLILQAQGPSMNDSAYMLGLQDDAPHRIAFRKGALVGGIPSAAPGTSGILRRGTTTYALGTWLHLMFDAVVNLNGDVILKALQNDLNANPVSAPVWTPIPGLENAGLVATHGAGTIFVDDALGVNSLSAPFTNGRMGFGFQSQDTTRRGFFDQIECKRQL